MCYKPVVKEPIMPGKNLCTWFNDRCYKPVVEEPIMPGKSTALWKRVVRASGRLA